MDWSSIIFGGLTAGATLLLAYLAWKAYSEGKRERLEERRQRASTFSPVADFAVKNLPPYDNDSQNTELIVTNNGNCNMVSPQTRVSYSWGGPARLYLDWEGDTILAPKESKTFVIKIPNPPLELGQQTISVECQCIHPLRNAIVGWERVYKVTIGR